MDLLLDLRRRLNDDIKTLRAYCASGNLPSYEAYRDVTGRIKGIEECLLHIEEIEANVKVAEG